MQKMSKAGEEYDPKPFPATLPGDLIAVKALQPSETKGGVILPEGTRMDVPMFKVLACGPGRHTPEGDVVEMGVKVGDLVLVNVPRENLGFPVDGEFVLILSERHVYAIVTDAARLYAKELVVPDGPTARLVQ